MKVSVIMITYNHDKFIGQAIQSVLDQNVDFKYEIIIADDASKDNTAKVIKEYSDKYGAVIKPILREKNIGAPRNVLDAVSHATGEYIAFLEGDDFFLDNNKLKKQVDFLDNNNEYAAVSSESTVVNEKGIVTDKKAWRFTIDEQEYTISNLEKLQLPGQMSTIVIRNYKEDIKDLFNKIKKYKFCPLDSLLPLMLLSKGKIYVFKENLSAYRFFIKKGADNWSSKNDLNVTHNYFFFFMIIRDIERCGRFLGYDLNMIDEKIKYFNESYKFVEKYHSKKCIVMCTMILLFIKDKRRFLYLAKERRI